MGSCRFLPDMSPAKFAGQETQDELNAQTKNPPWLTTKGDLSHLASRSFQTAGGFQLVGAMMSCILGNLFDTEPRGGFPVSEQMEANGGLTPLTVHLDPRLIDWLDRINADLALRSRSAIVARLLGELAGIDVQDSSPISSCEALENPTA